MFYADSKIPSVGLADLTASSISSKSARLRAVGPFVTFALPFLILFFLTFALPPLLIRLLGEPQSIELSVDRALLVTSSVGQPAMEVHLNPKSAREFAMFTAKHLGHFVEAKFHAVRLTKAVLREPLTNGTFQVSVLPDHVEGTLNESNAADIAQKLSAANAQLEVRVAD